MDDYSKLHILAKRVAASFHLYLTTAGRSICLVGLLWFLTSCQKPADNSTPNSQQPTITATNNTPPILSTLLPTATPTIAPTPTPPLAALVNGQPILLSTFEKELARYEQGQIDLGLTPSADGSSHRTIVLDSLIDQMLITQAAIHANILITPEQVAQKLAELKQSIGDVAQFAAWLAANQWSEEEFTVALAQEMLTEALKSQITQDVPYTGIQIHARYLQVGEAALAESLHQRLLAGEDFAAIANEFSLDRLTGAHGGDLGFFPMNTLLVPEVEQAAFALQIGELSGVIPVTHVDGSMTYYIIQTLEKDEQRALNLQQRATLLQERFEFWLTEQRASAEIIRFVDAQ